MTRRLNQKGFSLVEGLLVIIALALVVFVGYYVWNTQNDANKTLDTANKSNQTSNTKKATTDQKYITIKEWGIKTPYRGDLTLEHVYEAAVDSNSPSGVWFSSKELDATSAQCASKVEYGGWIDRYAADQKYLYEGEATGYSNPTAAAQAATMDSSSYTHVGNYYYFYRHPQGACGESQNSLDLQSKTADDVKALLAGFKSIN